jgi:hypothetical protein
MRSERTPATPDRARVLSAGQHLWYAGPAWTRRPSNPSTPAAKAERAIATAACEALVDAQTELCAAAVGLTQAALTLDTAEQWARYQAIDQRLQRAAEMIRDVRVTLAERHAAPATSGV